MLFFEINPITDAMAPVDVMPVLGMFGGTISNISKVRRPTGAVDLLIGINCASLFPVVADDDAHCEGNLQLLTSKFGTGWLLDGTHPLNKPGAVMQDQETFERTHATWVTKFVKAPKRIVKTVSKSAPFTFFECEELGTSQPRRCGTCANCNRCSVRAQELTRKEQEKLGQIEASVLVGRR